MNVLVTGGSQGIGAAAVRLFVQEGWRVALGYRSSRQEALELAQETGAVPVQGDVSDPAQARGLVAQAEEALDGLDALVCCAGVALPIQLLTDTTDEQ